MEIYSSLQKINETKKTAVALGYFDGIHLGHRQVIGKAVSCAKENNLKSCVFTFTLPEKGAEIKGLSILSLPQKKLRINSLGIDNYFSPPFFDFCNLTPQNFVKQVLVNCLNAKHIFCGENFTFGKNKSGNTKILQELCKEYEITTHIVPMSYYENEEISSTKIRTALQNGDIEKANAMLCEAYSIDFEVLHGKKIGRKMGYPTINQVYPNGMILPKSGVYITKVVIDDKSYAGATGLGNRPTFDGDAITCETHIVNFNGELYNKNVCVEFYKYVKPNVKFDDIKMLEEYIHSTVQSSIEYFKI